MGVKEGEGDVGGFFFPGEFVKRYHTICHIHYINLYFLHVIYFLSSFLLVVLVRGVFEQMDGSLGISVTLLYPSTLPIYVHNPLPPLPLLPFEHFRTSSFFSPFSRYICVGLVRIARSSHNSEFYMFSNGDGSCDSEYLHRYCHL